MSSTNPQNSPTIVDDHGPSGPPPQEVIDRGYEADVYDSRTVLSVPLLVILFFVLAFSTVTILFGIIAYPKNGNPMEHPGAVKQNQAPLNERMGRLGRGPNNGEGQPRLEPLVVRSGESRAITRPPLAEGNSPEIHPEDIMPNKERFPTLYKTDAHQLGLDKSMDLSNEALSQLFPVQEGMNGLIGSQHVPTNANAARGAGPSQVIIPQLPGTPPKPKAEQNQPPNKKGGK